jgi:type III restriction enzyme
LFLRKKVIIVETKGLEDLGVPLKMARLKQWCQDLNQAQKNVEYDFLFVDEEGFKKYRPASFGALVKGFREYQ